MTPRQEQALSVIRNHWRAFRESPTRSEIGRALGITKVSAHLLVQGLERNGAVVTTPGKWRNICLAAKKGKS